MMVSESISSVNQLQPCCPRENFTLFVDQLSPHTQPSHSIQNRAILQLLNVAPGNRQDLSHFLKHSKSPQNFTFSENIS